MTFVIIILTENNHDIKKPSKLNLWNELHIDSSFSDIGNSEKHYLT